MERKEAHVEKEKKKSVGWSAQLLLDVTSKREFKHTEEIVQWRSINQEDVANFWKEVCAKWMRKSWRSTEFRNPRKVRTKDVVSRCNGEFSKTVKRYQPRNG